MSSDEHEAVVDPLIGRDLDGRFQIREKLGEGGMGAVYRAWQTSVEREIALKIISRDRAGDANAKKRFLREAKLASRLSHPHTVSVLDFGETSDGLLYLAMELIRGKTLAEVRRADGPFTVARAVRIGAQLCDALEAAHKLQIVHRDLKPGNIIILDDQPGRDLVKVLDFGLAKSVSVEDTHTTVSRDGAIVGTPAYMSPEQVLGRDVDGRSDLYALGVILYELLSGRLPFDVPTGQAMMVAHASMDPSGLPEAPRAMEDVILRLLRKPPDDRFQTAAEVRDALVAAGSGTSATSSTPSGKRRFTNTAAFAHTAADMKTPANLSEIALAPTDEPPRKRSPLVWAGGVAALVAASVLGWFLARGPRTETRVAEPAPPSPAPAPTPPPAAEVRPPVPETRPGDPPQPPVPSQESIQLTLSSTPPAEITIAGKPHGRTPQTVDWPKNPAEKLEITFRAKGHRTERRTITLDGPQEVKVKLRKQADDSGGFITPR